MHACMHAHVTLSFILHPGGFFPTSASGALWRSNWRWPGKLCRVMLCALSSNLRATPPECVALQLCDAAWLLKQSTRSCSTAPQQREQRVCLCSFFRGLQAEL